MSTLKCLIAGYPPLHDFSKNVHYPRLLRQFLKHKQGYLQILKLFFAQKIVMCAMFLYSFTFSIGILAKSYTAK